MHQQLSLCLQVLGPEAQLTVLQHMELAHSQQAGTAVGAGAAGAWVVGAAHIVATLLGGRRPDAGSSRQSSRIGRALEAACGTFISRSDACTAVKSPIGLSDY